MQRGLALGLILVVAIAVPSLIAGKGDAAEGKALYRAFLPRPLEAVWLR